MKKAGEIIKSARVDQKLSINDVVKKTKIPEDFIRAIENNSFDQLPDGVYAQLYVRKYAQFLNLSSEKLAAIFRRDYEKTEKTTRFSFQQLNFFSKWQGYIAVGFLVALFISYLGYQYLNFVRPPSVRINQINLTSQGWVVTGRTHPQATLKIDNQIINLTENGQFTYTTSRNNNQIQIIVQSPAGRTKEVIRQLE